MSHDPRSVEILVVDDSALARQRLREAIELEPSFRVSMAGDPYEAVDLLRDSVPAAIVLDVDMPRMDGLTFLRKLMRQHPLPVILCTDHPQRGLAGLELGAVEVIAKPHWSDPGDLAAWGQHLRTSLLDALAARARDESRAAAATAAGPGPEPRLSADVILPPRRFSQAGVPAARLIVVGASTGGVQAIARLLADFPEDAPGMLIVQHMPEVFTAAFASRLDCDPKIELKVTEAKPFDTIRPGHALVAPGHAHLVVRRSPGGYRIELADGPPVNRHRPSVDVLFRSAAQAAGPRACGILLTGMGDDGASGLLELREAGSWTIAQDEATSVVFGMPREAIRRGAARQVLSLDRIAPAVATWYRTS